MKSTLLECIWNPSSSVSSQSRKQQQEAIPELDTLYPLESDVLQRLASLLDRTKEQHHCCWLSKDDAVKVLSSGAAEIGKRAFEEILKDANSLALHDFLTKWPGFLVLAGQEDNEEVKQSFRNSRWKKVEEACKVEGEALIKGQNTPWSIAAEQLTDLAWFPLIEAKWKTHKKALETYMHWSQDPSWTLPSPLLASAPQRPLRLLTLPRATTASSELLDAFQEAFTTSMAEGCEKIAVDAWPFHKKETLQEEDIARLKENVLPSVQIKGDVVGMWFSAS